MRKTFSVLGLACLLLLTACGSKSPASKSFTTLEPNHVLQKPEFPEGSSMKRIQNAGKIRIGVPFNQPGFGVKSSGDQAPIGFDIEMAKLITQGIFGGRASDQNEHIDYVETVSTNRETFLQTNKVDIVIAAYPITDARKVLVDFAGPYYMSHGDVMVPVNDRTIQHISDLNGRNICTKTGSLLVQSLLQKAPQVNVTYADNYAQCVQSLRDGTISGVMSDQVVVAGLVSTNTDIGRVLGSNFSDDPYGIGLPKGDVQLQAFLNDRIETVVKSGDWVRSYNATIGQLGIPTPEPPAVVRPAVTTSTS